MGGAYELFNSNPSQWAGLTDCVLIGSSQWAGSVRFNHPSQAQFLLLILTRTVLLLLLGKYAEVLLRLT